MNDESKIFGVSVRAFICLLLTFCVCAMAVLKVSVNEPLYSAFLLALGFFFGQKSPIINQGGTNEKV